MATGGAEVRSGRRQPWPMVRLGDVCEIRAGANYREVEDPQGKYPIYGTGGIMGRSSQYRCPAHSVIVGRKGTLDNPFLVDEPFWNIDTCFGVVPSEKILPEFLFRFCQGFDFYSLVPASGRPSTTSNAVRAILLPLPPLAEQREIVARLERELAAVEKMKAGFEALAETAQREFKAELREAFEELKRKEAKICRLEELCHLIADCPHTTAKDEGRGYPLVRTPNIGFGELVYANMHRVCEDVYLRRNSRAKPQPNDLIFAREAPAGNVAVIKQGEVVCLGQRTVLLRPKIEVIKPMWLAYYILSPSSQESLIGRATGATVAHVNVSDIRSFKVSFPTLEEQDACVSCIDSAKARAEKLEAKAKEGAAVCETLRKAILKEAFAGAES